MRRITVFQKDNMVKISIGPARNPMTFVVSLALLVAVPYIIVKFINNMHDAQPLDLAPKIFVILCLVFINVWYVLIILGLAYTVWGERQLIMKIGSLVAVSKIGKLQRSSTHYIEYKPDVRTKAIRIRGRVIGYSVFLKVKNNEIKITPPLLEEEADKLKEKINVFYENGSV